MVYKNNNFDNTAVSLIFFLQNFMLPFICFILGAKTLSITTLSIMKFSKMVLSIMTFSVMALRIKYLYLTQSINDTEHN
jgi:hypothetical protein